MALRIRLTREGDKLTAWVENAPGSPSRVVAVEAKSAGELKTKLDAQFPMPRNKSEAEKVKAK